MFAIVTAAGANKQELIDTLNRALDELKEEWIVLGHPPNMIGGNFEFEVRDNKNFAPMGSFIRPDW